MNKNRAELSNKAHSVSLKPVSWCLLFFKINSRYRSKLILFASNRITELILQTSVFFLVAVRKFLKTFYVLYMKTDTRSDLLSQILQTCVKGRHKNETRNKTNIKCNRKCAARTVLICLIIQERRLVCLNRFSKPFDL